MRTNVGLDIYNILNSAAVLTYNQTFIPATATAAEHVAGADRRC